MPEATWSDDLKSRVVERYLELEPTPENSMELVKQITDELAEDDIAKTVNGVRMVLSKAEVYVKKTATTAKAADDKKPKKMSKADAVAGLKKAIEAAGAEFDEAIVGKMTGIAAEYFTGVINATQD